jgi:hypothetical protein
MAHKQEEGQRAMEGTKTPAITQRRAGKEVEARQEMGMARRTMMKMAGKEVEARQEMGMARRTMK